MHFIGNFVTPVDFGAHVKISIPTKLLITDDFVLPGA